ncbi:MAG: hypothetical protein WEC79_09250 [Thermomicrobiales bacterium]
MVLVRKTELACRNSWDQDLWEIGDRPVELQPSTHIPMPAVGGDPLDMPVAHAELTADGEARAGEMFTDRITSISMPIRSQLRPGRVEPEPVAGDSASAELSSSRSSVREARRRRQEQRFLERKKHQETVLQNVDDLLNTREPVEESDRNLIRLRAVDGPMTAERDPGREPPSRDRQRPGTTGAPDPRRRHDDSRQVEFRAAPTRFQEASPKELPDADPEPIARVRPEPGKRQSNGSHANVPVTRESSVHGGTEPLPTELIRAEVRKRRDKQAEAAGDQLDQQDRGHHARPSIHGSAVPVETRREPPPAVDPRPTTWFTGAGHPGAPQDSSDVATPFEVDPIDLSRDLQTVRRCCATCRDFKQIGDGKTGWCNNPYAFSERRMVQSNEIACRSSFGVWWLPHDDLWLEHADTTHHGRPTPLLDDLVGTGPANRQGMGTHSS